MRCLIPLLLLSSVALGADVDPASLYTLDTRGSTEVLDAHGKGLLVVSLRPVEGAHLSPSTPFKLELTGDKVQPQTRTLKLGDAVQGPKSTPPAAFARFEIPLTATGAGEGRVEAKLTFFICTEHLCLRQERALSIPVRVR